MSRAGRTSASTPVAGAGALLLLGTLASNVLAYVFLLVLARHLNAAGFGAIGSLVNLSTICSVPALGLQLVGARLVSRAREVPAGGPAEGGVEARVLRLAWELGGGVAAVVALASPVLATLLHLQVGAVLVLAAGLVPMALTYAAQGVLQGEERFGRLALVLALTGLMRAAAGVGAALAGFDVLGVVALLSAGWVVTAAVALLLLPARHRVAARHSEATLIRMVGHAVVPTSGLLVLSSLDVLLARHHLSVEASGAYTVGAIFEKAAFWGMAFLATLYYPRMARPSQRAGAVRFAVGITAGVGVLGVVASVLFGGLLASLAGGDGYAGLGSLVWRFTALGVGIALVQVLVYAGLATGRGWMGPAVWAASGLAVLVVGRRHDSVSAIVTGMLACVALLAAAALALECRTLLTVNGRHRARTHRPQC